MGICSCSCSALQSLSRLRLDAMRRDPKKRLTAKQALQHPWLAHGNALERTRGPPLDTTVVQRLQVPTRPLLFFYTTLVLPMCLLKCSLIWA